MSFFEKLKSWKRLSWIFATVLPVAAEVATQQLGWMEAVTFSLIACLAGLGVIGIEDITKIRAGASRQLPPPPKE